MNKYILFLVCSIVCLFSEAQKMQKPGDCTGYRIEGRQVVFTSNGKARLSLTFCSNDVIRIWYAPEGEFKRSNESFAVINDSLGTTGTLNIEEQPQAYEIFTGSLRVRINKSPFQLQLFDKYQKMLLGDYKDQGYLNDSSKIMTYKTLRDDEQFFGLGEKTGPLNKRGRSYKMWNSDKPCYSPNEDPIYKSIPFFMSSYHYGIFFDNTFKSFYRFGSESDDYYSFGADGGDLVYYFIHGTDYKNIIEQYMGLTGKPIMPPEWALGFSQCRGMFTNEKLALSTAAEFRKRRIPCDIIYQDIGWGSSLQNFDWSPERYSNPKGMLHTLDSMGFKMIVSQDPVISQRNVKQWREADSLHYFTTDIRTGKSYDMPWPWGGNCGVVDFTKPEVADWWGSYQQKPLDDGVSGFWTDMGEPAWSNEEATDRLYMKHYLGMHQEIHNVYGLTWDKVVKEQFEKRNPGKRIFQMTRSAYAGLQRYTFGWSGDSGNGNDVLDGWDNLAGQIPLSLSAGLSLLPFWACDISGYCGDIKDYPAMAELYVRWLQFGVFNPLSRSHHEGNNAAEPWLFGAEAEKICQDAIRLKYRLFPYFYTYAREAYDKGLPLMRPLLLEYPDDPETYHANGEFLLGKELLVAPVVKKGAVTKRIYLPAGQWIDFNNGKTEYEGEQTITYKAPLNVIPILVKKGSMIPMMPVMDFIHQHKVYPVTIETFPAEENQIADFKLYEDDGISLNYQKDQYAITSFSCTTKEKAYEIKISAHHQGYTVNGKRNFILNLHLDKKPSGINKGKIKYAEIKSISYYQSIEKDFKTLTWTWDAIKGICSIKIPESDQDQIIQVLR